MTLNFERKFCRRPGSVEIPEEDVADVAYHFDKWIPWLSCNRCADYRVKRRQVVDSVLNACRWWDCLTPELQSDPKQKDKTRAILDRLTKDFVTTVSEFHKKTNVWESAIVETIMDNPRQAFGVLMQTVKTIRTMEQQPELI